MIILKLTDVFEIHIHFKMITLKRKQMFFNYTFNLKWWNYNWVFKEITKSFAFKYFQKREVYLDPIQISNIELFVKIVNSLILLIILIKSSILDAWLVLKKPLKASIKAFMNSTFLALPVIFLNTFLFLLCWFLFLPIFKNYLQVLL